MKKKSSNPFILLASQSPRRRQILSELGLPFRVIPSRYVESGRRGLPPSRLVMGHALGKVRKAVVSGKKGIVMGADTIVYYRKKVFGKPGGLRRAFRMLSDLSGRWHRVYTGMALYNPANGRTACGYAKTRVLFKKLTSQDIKEYLASIHPIDKAGAYAIQDGPQIIRKIKGSYTNVIGLPVELLGNMLAEISATKKLRFIQRRNRISTFKGQ